MSTVMRTLRSIRKIGIRDFLHQIQNIGDTKAGTYIASDRYGNKYYENLEQELPCMLCIYTIARDFADCENSTDTLGRL